jgi:hypothetical protein
METPAQSWEEPCQPHVCYVCRNKRVCMVLPDPYEQHMAPDDAIRQFFWCRECYHKRDKQSLNIETGKSK